MGGESSSESNKKNKDYYYIWVDSKIKNSENSEYAKFLSKTYANISFFNNIKDALKSLQKIKFNLTYIIVSGSFFAEFITELKKFENKISTVPKIIIFTSEKRKAIIQNMNEINDSFYNIGGIAVTFEDVQSFLDTNIFGKELNYVRSLRRDKIQSGGDFSFQIIENKNDLVGPVYLSDLIIKPYKLEYIIFDKYLIDNYGDIMNALISQVYNVDCPVSLRVKYWLRAYTLETKFYKDMNSDLMKDKSKIYLPYIKLLYSGLTDNNIITNVSDDLYRGALINKDEVQNLINHLNNKKSSDIPWGLIYCKSFMSFSIDINVALHFMQNKNPNEKKVRVLYILKAESGIDHKNVTNADLNDISFFEEEREILLFPFSIYEINAVIKKSNYYEIYLNYLGKYKELFQFKNQTDLYNSIFQSKFIQELELAGLSTPIWLAKKSLCKIYINDNIRASGFCCLIPLINKKTKIPVLIGNNHLLREENLTIGKKILLEYNENKKYILIIDKNTRIYSSQEYDITIIEMKNYNDISNQLIFMDIDEDIFNDENFIVKNFYKAKAYILQYAKPTYGNEYDKKGGYILKKNIEEFTKDKEYSIKEGDIIIKDEKNIMHNIPTSPGAGGGPIISHNKFKVIGCHKGKLVDSFSQYRGIGNLLKLPIQGFINKFYS